MAAASAANAGSGGGGGGATLQLSCAKGCAVRGCNFTGNAASGANGGGLLANVSYLGFSGRCCLFTIDNMTSTCAVAARREQSVPP